MYGLLGSDNICLRLNYLKMWNLRVQKKIEILRNHLKVVKMKFLTKHITNQKVRFDIFT